MDGTVAHTRVSDTERDVCDARLRDAVGRGLLTLAEYEQRAGEVWRAQTHGDLAILMQDLPAELPAPGRPQSSAGRRIAIAGVVILGAGTFLGFHTIASMTNNVGDRLVFVPTGVSDYKVPDGVGNVTVVVPDGVQAEPVMTGVGSVSCNSACARTALSTVRVTYNGVGNLDIETRQEHEGSSP